MGVLPLLELVCYLNGDEDGSLNVCEEKEQGKMYTSSSSVELASV
jgi:hypothetical protein